MSENARKYLTGHVSAETAFIQAGYPYGRRGKCLRRVWIEQKDGKGFRFVYQTSAPYYPEDGQEPPIPSAARWNKPKASTYTPCEVLYLDENEHIHGDVLGHWNNRPDADASPEGDIDAFETRAKDAIGAREADAIKGIRILRRAASRVKYTIREDVRPFPRTDEERAARQAEEDERKKDEKRFINALVANESAKMDGAPVPFPSLDAATAPGVTS